MTVRIPKWLLIIGGVLLLGAAAAYGGYLYGESSVDQEALTSEARQEGREAGERAGRRAADDNSFSELIREFKDGAKMVMGGYDEDWEPSGWYIVRVSKKYPRGFVGSWISYRQPLTEGLAYSTCGANADEICYTEEG